MSGSRILPGSLPLPAPASPRERALNSAIGNIYDVLARRLRDEIQSGTFTERPVSSGAPRFFFATDTEELYFDTASGWVAIPGGVGTITPPTGTGFWHSTGGVLDAATKLVDTADINDAQVTYAKIQNVANHRVLGRDSSGSGVVEEVAASGVLDWIGSTRGAVLYRGSGGWALLTPGTDGNVLTTHGAGADPTWETPSASASLTITDGVTTVDPVSDIEFTSGATVTDAGSGLAQIAIAGGGGGSITWEVGSLTTMLSTELNSLGSGTATAVGTEYDNSSNLYMFADFELNVTFGTAPTASTPVNIYLIPALDGTNYASGSSSVLPANTGIGSFLVLNSTSAQRLMLRGIVIPPCKFKIIAENATNQAFPASGSTVKMLPYGEQMN